MPDSKVHRTNSTRREHIANDTQRGSSRAPGTLAFRGRSLLASDRDGVSQQGRGVHRPFAPFGLVGEAVAAAGAGLREVELSGHVLEEAVRVLVVAGPFDLGHAQRDGRIEAR